MHTLGPGLSMLPGAGAAQDGIYTDAAPGGAQAKGPGTGIRGRFAASHWSKVFNAGFSARDWAKGRTEQK